MNVQSPSSPAQIHAGMGAILRDGGAAFRVWAPNATAVEPGLTEGLFDEAAAPVTESSGAHVEDAGDEAVLYVNGVDIAISDVQGTQTVS